MIINQLIKKKLNNLFLYFENSNHFDFTDSNIKSIEEKSEKYNNSHPNISKNKNDLKYINISNFKTYLILILF